MPSQGTLTLHEYNDEEIDIVLWEDVQKTVPLDITGALVYFIYKTSSTQADDDAIIIPAEIINAVTGHCKVGIDNEQVSLTRRFFRIDVVAGGERKTAIYGPISIVDL